MASQLSADASDRKKVLWQRLNVHRLDSGCHGVFIWRDVGRKPGSTACHTVDPEKIVESRAKDRR